MLQSYLAIPLDATGGPPLTKQDSALLSTFNCRVKNSQTSYPLVTCMGSLSPHTLSSLHSSHSLIHTFYPHACSVGSVFREKPPNTLPSYREQHYRIYNPSWAWIYAYPGFYWQYWPTERGEHVSVAPSYFFFPSLHPPCTSYMQNASAVALADV